MCLSSKHWNFDPRTFGCLAKSTNFCLWIQNLKTLGSYETVKSSIKSWHEDLLKQKQKNKTKNYSIFPRMQWNIGWNKNINIFYCLNSLCRMLKWLNTLQNCNGWSQQHQIANHFCWNYNDDVPAAIKQEAYPRGSLPGRVSTQCLNILLTR